MSKIIIKVVPFGQFLVKGEGDVGGVGAVREPPFSPFV